MNRWVRSLSLCGTPDFDELSRVVVLALFGIEMRRTGNAVWDWAHFGPGGASTTGVRGSGRFFVNLLRRAARLVGG
jgi:hypothetical protein